MDLKKQETFFVVVAHSPNAGRDADTQGKV